MALLPRIPLYGGWSTDFVYGFEVPEKAFRGRASDGRRELIYSLSPHVKGLVTEEQTIRVRASTGRCRALHQLQRPRVGSALAGL